MQVRDDGSSVTLLCVGAAGTPGVIHPNLPPRISLQISHHLNGIFRNLLFRPCFQRLIQADGVSGDQRE